jgi:hypothetical protein
MVQNLSQIGVCKPRRYATLVAIVLEAEATLTDEILDLHDRLIGAFFCQGEAQTRAGVYRSGSRPLTHRHG